jgi:hypothetical protein
VEANSLHDLAQYPQVKNLSSCGAQHSEDCLQSKDNSVLEKEHFFKTRVSDADWIRIRNPDLDPYPYSGGQKLPTKVEKIKKFHVLKCWMFSFES